MFDRCPTYYPKAGLSPNSPLKAREFLLEEFTPEDESPAASVPPKAAPKVFTKPRFMRGLVIPPNWNWPKALAEVNLTFWPKSASKMIKARSRAS